MSFEPRYLTGKYENDFLPIVELFEELARGLQDSHIRGSAAISASKLRSQDLGEFDLTTSERPIPHTLGVEPLLVHVRPYSNFQVWESTRGNSGRIYLTASTTGRARVWVAG